MKYVLDTNVVIRLLKNDTIIKNTLEGIVLFDDDDICISAITYYELKKGVNAIGKSRAFDSASKDWKILLYDELETFEKAIRIYDDLAALGYNRGCCKIR